MSCPLSLVPVAIGSGQGLAGDDGRSAPFCALRIGIQPLHSGGCIVTSALGIVRRVTAAMAVLAVTGAGMTAAAQAPAAAPATPAAATAAPAAAAAAPGSICGTQPACYDASDFAATITDFRTTAQGGYRIIDVTMRFINKTNTTLGLGYANGSGLATDDRGNRYAVGGPNAFRGIGVVNGNSFDPKFSVRPGGYGDARFELLFAPGQAIIGSTFELDLTVNEINTVEGNQHTLGGEFPLEFKSLVNGSTGPAPGAVTYASAGQVAPASPPPCGPAGTVASAASATNNTGAQSAANSATNAVNTTANAVSSVGSLFGKKKPAASSSAAAPCTPASPANTTAATGAPAAAATNGAPGAATTAAAKTPVTAPQTRAAAATATPVAAPAKTATPATAAAATTKAPAPAAAPAATPATPKATTPKPTTPPATTPATTTPAATNGAVVAAPPKTSTP
jgi:hypothetical protein